MLSRPPRAHARRESSEASIARSAIEDGAVHPLHREAMEMRSAWCDTNERREVGRVRTGAVARVRRRRP